MRTLSLLALATALAACNKPATQAERVTPAPESVSVVTLAPAPAATPEPAVAEAKQPADPLAPDGVFYLLAQTSITTDDGIFGLKPGTQLRAAGEGEYRDPEGRAVKLRADQVTNNLRLASLAARSDAKAQAAITQSINQAHVASATVTTATAAEPAPEPARTTARAPVSHAVAKAATPDPRALGATHDRQKDNGYTDKEGRKHWKDIRGNWHTD